MSRLSRLVSRTRQYVPQSVAGALANCGGTNLRADRFAARLESAQLTEDEYLGICHALIFPNGVRRTTSPGRNTNVIGKLVEDGRLTIKSHARVLDIGAALGLDALTTFRLLQEKNQVDAYVLGDLHTRVLYDRRRGLVFDEDMNLLQVRRRFGFVAMYFSYNYAAQRVLNWPKKLGPWLLRRKFGPPRLEETVAIPLIHPSIDVRSGESPFRLKRLDVFKPIGETFDLIICMHLLVPRYFSATVIEDGIRNLASALEIGGTLLVGATEAFRTVTRVAENEFVTTMFP